MLDLGPKIGRVLPLICYEAVFPDIPRAVARPDWMLQVTNDAWFGTWTGPFQHFQQARLRAMEMGLNITPRDVVDITPAGDDVVKLVGAPQGCTIKITRPKTQAPQQTLSEQAFEALRGNGEEFGLQFTPKTLIACP